MDRSSSSNTPNTLSLYCFFHLNLAFSSIPEECRGEVIEKCYRPLLELAQRHDWVIGFEASGYTLEEIALRDPEWIQEFRLLCAQGRAEFIGSGYSQLIGPLAPAQVNHANQRIGLEVYEKLLGFRPRLALVNEQAFSSGLVDIYRQAGYQGLIMEWDNPAREHPEWRGEWRYFPQYVCGPEGTSIPVIWNKCIPFQKFQRFVHGEMELEEYLNYLGEMLGPGPRTFSLYGNDAEIFNFRPGRFQTETSLGASSEWERIATLFARLREDDRFAMVSPIAVLDFLSLPQAGHQLHLESTGQPVPVKKQAKYNLLRWALTGRDDLDLNSRCWRLYQAFCECSPVSEEDWKELCFLWSSDFRTHITESRWAGMLVRLAGLEKKFAVAPARARSTVSVETDGCRDQDVYGVRREGNYLEVETPRQQLRLNCRRGLAVDHWSERDLGADGLIRTLPHGYFDDIHFGADYYTGHFVFEAPGQHKITDLVPVSPSWEVVAGCLRIRAEIKTALGSVIKEIVLEHEHGKLGIEYHFQWPSCPSGTLRLGHITLNPECFREDKLFFKCHNGGEVPENFFLHGRPINHLAPVSALVSASQGLGLTAEAVEIGDNRRSIFIQTDKASAAVTGHIFYAPVEKRYLYRLIFSAMEIDDTAANVHERTSLADRKIIFELTPRKNPRAH